LEAPEEAMFVATEDQRVLSIDGDDTAVMCWGERERMATQAYRQKGLTCRLHLLPGRHVVGFQSGLTVRRRETVEFTAEPGTVYTLRRGECDTAYNGARQTCRYEIVEVGSGGRGG
jgi:hypothetical protein